MKKKIKIRQRDMLKREKTAVLKRGEKKLKGGKGGVGTLKKNNTSPNTPVLCKGGEGWV